jgi:hypothetical protein
VRRERGRRGRGGGERADDREERIKRRGGRLRWRACGCHSRTTI